MQNALNWDCKPDLELGVGSGRIGLGVVGVLFSGDLGGGVFESGEWDGMG